jgi:hypothetical protein
MKKLVVVLFIGTFLFSSAYASCESGNCENGQGTKTFPDGRKYVGQFSGGTYDGQGTFTFPDGRKYVGGFRYSLASGQGTLTFPDGRKYVGVYKNGERNGQGILYWPNGKNKYVGEWKDGKMHGYGTFTFRNGRKYIGEFKDDKYNGQGILYFADGTVNKEGEWVNDKLVIYAALIEKGDPTEPRTGISTTPVVQEDVNPPKIIISSPDVSRGIKVAAKGKRISVKGRAIDKSGIYEVNVNNVEARLTEGGYFTSDILLAVGENKIRVKATDTKNNVSEKVFTIIRKSQSQATPEYSSEGSPGIYYALVIGNNEYEYLPKLISAKNDAMEVSKVLKNEYGFKIQILRDATRQQIVNALNNLRKTVSVDDSVLIYYAGHGEFDKSADKAYWLPVDAESDDDSNWIIVDRITANIKRTASNHILIVADSCYSGTLTRKAVTDMRSKQKRERYLKKMMKRSSRTILASGGNEPVSDSGGDGHSVFAQAFIDGLKEMEMTTFTAEELFYEYVKEVVAGSAEQIPEYNTIRNSGHKGGDFVFKRIR